ncbi:hypothetical protein [Sphingobacterium sp. MYb382]|uniref:hypothetical protein n=1 Tax=Sphingobacterium sp. MYb382 TaxID=2745278 RepID=UPI0030B7B67E
MKKKIEIFLALLCYPLFTYSQRMSNNLYAYQASHYYESIDLLDNGSFVYYNKSEFIKTEIEGNWQLRSDSILVLDSWPQRTKIITFESHKRDKKNIFQIRNTNNHQIHYNLYLITKDKDTLEFKDQFDKTTVLGSFSSFYIVDTKGQYSPTYKIVGSKSNFFDVMIEEKRVFENEYWKYYGEYIVPLGINRRYSNYRLIKNK